MGKLTSELWCPAVLSGVFAFFLLAVIDKLQINVNREEKPGQKLRKKPGGRKEQKQRSWRNTVYWLAPHGLPSLLSYTTENDQYRRELLLEGCPSEIKH